MGFQNSKHDNLFGSASRLILTIFLITVLFHCCDNIRCLCIRGKSGCFCSWLYEIVYFKKNTLQECRKLHQNYINFNIFLLTTLTYINWTHIHIRVGLIPVWLSLKLGLDNSTSAGVDLEMVCKIEIRFTTDKARFGSIKKRITRDYATGRAMACLSR